MKVLCDTSPLHSTQSPHPKVLYVLSLPCNGVSFSARTWQSTSSGGFVCCGSRRFILFKYTPGGYHVPWSLVCGDEEEERKCVICGRTL